jgi:hypothetical protein
MDYNIRTALIVEMKLKSEEVCDGAYQGHRKSKEDV